jgi:microcystin degradation protein MlrC
MRIAVGGFQHETNTFASVKATLADFTAADAWPGLVRGAEMLEAVRGINLPVTGFIEAATERGHELVPLSWCSATPSGYVTRDAFEHVSQLLLTDLRTGGNVDAVYLDLHGAMVAEHFDDADGELLTRVRHVIGPNIPIVASLDFHANVSHTMVEQASALCAYRTYPHVDMAETGVRTYRALHDLQSRAVRGRLAPLRFLIPLTAQCTLIEPLKSLMAEVSAQERFPVISCNFTPGFPAADVADCRPAVFAYGYDDAKLQGVVHDVAAKVADRESDFALEIYLLEQMLSEIGKSRTERGRPIVIADTQDNPGAGGNADTTSLIKALIAARLPSVLAGIICDPDAAKHAHAVGEGASIELELGARTRFEAETPIRARFEVIALGDGKFTGTGPFYKGARMELGPMAFGAHRRSIDCNRQQEATGRRSRDVSSSTRRSAGLWCGRPQKFRPLPRGF